MRRLLGVIAVVSLGCGSTYPVGLTVSGETVSTSDETFFKTVDGEGTVARFGHRGVAPTCDEAAMPEYALTNIRRTTTQMSWQVFGETSSGHPLLPGGNYGSTKVSLVRQDTHSVVDTESFYTYYSTDSDDESEWQESTQDLTAAYDVSSYYGVASGEYIFKLRSLSDLWEDIDSSDANANVTLITKTSPSDGEFWSDTNGNTVYQVDGTRDLSVGSETVEASQILMFQVTDAGTMGQDLMEVCLEEGLYEEVDSSDGDEESYLTVVLNATCSSNFTHSQVGTQWWFEKVLVGEETTTYSVEVLDYGYEWYEENEDLGVCTRQTSKDQDASPDAKLFLEYALTVSGELWEADSMGVVDEAEISAAP